MLPTPHGMPTVLGLTLVGMLLGAGRGGAQVPGAPARLTDPHTVTIPARNSASGRFTLESVPAGSQDKYHIYVPPACVGRRCPMLIAPSNTGTDQLEFMRPGADQYGIIVLLLLRTSGDLYGALARGERHPVTEELDLALREVYRRFAIDPDKIAIMGKCDTGMEAAFWGYYNAPLFSRIVMNSSQPHFNEATWANPTAEFLYVLGLTGENFNVGRVVGTAADLRRRGIATKVAPGFRLHGHQVEDYTFIARWLHESWTMPAAKRPSPQVAADPVPRLTPEALAKMTTFWTRFQQEPESIRTVARRSHLREVVIPMGSVPLSTVMVDMAALAAQAPSVARALQAAGLTAAYHDAYRVALASARVLHDVRQNYRRHLEALAASDTLSPSAWAALAKFAALRKVKHDGRWPGQPAGDTTTTLSPRLARLMVEYDNRGSRAILEAVDTSSVLKQNEAFLRTHPDALQALEATGMWKTP